MNLARLTLILICNIVIDALEFTERRLRLRLLVFQLDQPIKDCAQLIIFWLVDEFQAKTLPEKVLQVRCAQLIVAQVLETIFELYRSDFTEGLAIVRLVVDLHTRQLASVQEKDK